MKKNLQKYILSILMGSLVLSLVAIPVSAQFRAEVCYNSAGQAGTFQGGICIATGGGQGAPVGGQQGGGAPLYQQGNFNLSIVSNLITQLQNLLAQGVPLLIGFAVLYFLYNLITYVLMADKPEERGKNLKNMGYSLLAIFVMVSIWGLIAFIGSVSGIGGGGTAPLPGLPTYQQ